MKRFQKNTTLISPRQAMENQYKVSRMNLLIAIVFTLINIIMALTAADTYFLFSAMIPYHLVVMGMYLCGKLPAEYYEGSMSDYIFFDNSYLVGSIAIAALCLVALALCWFFSRKQKTGGLIAALVLFIIDTVGMFYLYGFAADMLINIFFHAWVIFYLINGIRACKKLKFLPEDEPVAAMPDQTVEGGFAEATFSAEENKAEENKADDKSDFDY